MALTDEKRAQILDAAVEEFRELGFAGTSMDRIANRAKVSKRTVYNHFESKEALFRAILDLMAVEAELALDISYDPERPIEPQLHDLGWAEGKLLVNPSFMRLARMVVGETMRDPVLAAEMNCKMQRISVFGDFIADAAAAGALKTPEPTLAAEQFIGLIKARAFWPVIFSGVCVGEEEMGRIIRDSVSVFLNTYGI